MDLKEQAQRLRLFTPVIDAKSGNYPTYSQLQQLFSKQKPNEAPLTLESYHLGYVYSTCHAPGYNKETKVHRLFDGLPGEELLSQDEYKEWMTFVEPYLSETFPPPTTDATKYWKKFRKTIFSETICVGILIDLLTSQTAEINSYFLAAEEGTIKLAVRDLKCFGDTLDNSTHLNLPRASVALLSQLVTQYSRAIYPGSEEIHKVTLHRELVNIIGTYSKSEAKNFICALQDKIKKIKLLLVNYNNSGALINRLVAFEGQLANYTTLLDRQETWAISVLANIHRIEAAINKLLRPLASSEQQSNSSSVVAETKASAPTPLSVLMLPVFLTADTAHQVQIRQEQKAAEQQLAANLLQQLEQAMAKEYALGQLMRARKLAQTAFKVRVFYEIVLSKIYALPQENQQTGEQQHLSSQLLPILPHTIEPSITDAELGDINSKIENGINFFRNYGWYLATRARYLQLAKSIYKTEEERFFFRIIKEGLRDVSEGEHKEEEKKQQEPDIAALPENPVLKDFDKYFTVITAMDRNERLGKWYLETREKLKEKVKIFFARNSTSPLLTDFELELNKDIDKLPKYPNNVTELKEAHDSLVSLEYYFQQFKKSYNLASWWKKTLGLKLWYLIALLLVFVGELCIFLAAGTNTLTTLANVASFAIGGFRISALISLLAIVASPFIINWSEKKAWYPEKKLAMDVLGGALLVIGVTGVTFALIGPEAIIAFSQSAQGLVNPAFCWLSGFGLLIVAAFAITFNYIRNNVDLLSDELAKNKNLADNNKISNSAENFQRLLDQRVTEISSANLSALLIRTPSPTFLQRASSSESIVSNSAPQTISSSFSSSDALTQASTVVACA